MRQFSPKNIMRTRGQAVQEDLTRCLIYIYDGIPGPGVDMKFRGICRALLLNGDANDICDRVLDKIRERNLIQCFGDPEFWDL